MFGGLKREKKPQSQIVRQVRTTSVLIILLQFVCLFVGVGIFVTRARAELLETTDQLAGACAGLVSETNPTDTIREILRLSREASASGKAIDEEVIAAIAKTEGYQKTLEVLRNFLPGNVYYIALVAYDNVNDQVIFIADGNQTLGDTSAMGSILDLPEDLHKKIRDRKSYTSHTVLTPTGDIDAMSAQYLVEGDPTAGIIYVSSTDSVIITETAQILLLYTSVSLVVYGFILYFMNSRTRKLLVNPINTITEAIRLYSQDRSSGNFERRHFASLDIQTNNELETLSTTLAKMELDVSVYVKEMERFTAEKEREEAELRMAARIQESALPNVFPAFPDRPEFEIYASMTPAKEVGGDFYDFFLVDDDHLCMVMADVSDKGVPAALFMMRSKTTIALNIMAGKSPAEALKDANADLCENNQACMFVTVWVGVLELSTGKLVASNAAHEYPVLQRPRGRFALYQDRHAIMVGARKKAKYTDYQLVLRPGSKLFVYTDGVPEATNAAGEMFGLDRMVDALNETRKASPEEVLDNMKHSVDEFVQDASQFDDLTMLCLEYKGAKKQP